MSRNNMNQEEEKTLLNKTYHHQFTYTLQTLNTIDEVKQWTKFCADCFSYKTNAPPSTYFLRHFMHDPLARPQHIFVATCEDSIVASVRIFIRELNDGVGGVIRAGGIGEVCTSSMHRKKGLSHRLLSMALMSMSDNNLNLQVSLLHASDVFQPVYAKFGYVSSCTRWVQVRFRFRFDEYKSATSITSISKGRSRQRYIVREVEFPNDIKVLSHMYTQLNTKHRGCLIRSHDYWEKYVGPEMFLASGCAKPLVLCDDDKPIAWLSLRIISEHECIIKDFGCIPNDSSISISDVLSILIHHIFNNEDCIPSNYNYISMKSKHQDVSCNIKLPTFLWDQVKLDVIDTTCTSNDVAANINQRKSSSGFIPETVESDDDFGWMYKVLENDNNNNDENMNMSASYFLQNVTIIHSNISKEGHFIWPTDSF